MKRVYLLLLFLCSITLYSNQLTGENFQIIQKKKSYLDIYYLDKDSGQIPVFDNGLLVNSRIYIKDSTRRFYLRDHGKFFTKVEKDALTIIWKIDKLDIIEVYREEDGYLNYSVEVTNRGDKGRLVGIYFVYDTILGEKSGKHFIDSEGEVYNREISFQGFDIPGSIRSVNENNQGIEFIFPSDKDKKPDRVILGNWELLAKSKKWPYIPNNGGRFSYGYYSINDSGIGLVYPSVSIDKGKSFTHSFKLRFLPDGSLPDSSLEEPVTKEDSKWDSEIKEPEPEDEVILDEPGKVSNTSSELDLKNESDEIDLDILDLEIGDKPLDPEKEELLIMLEYIQKKKRGEDVSGYDFDDNYVIEKLKEINE